MRTYSTGQFASAVGVSVKTLQRWDREGKLRARRTPAGRRLYDEDQLFEATGRMRVVIAKKTVAYIRVSSQGQKPDLKNQRASLEQFCVAKGLAIDEWIEEIGGGLNFKRAKFIRLIDDLNAGRISCLLIAHKDRLARFGFDLLRHLAVKGDCELIVMNQESLSPEREMVEDLMAITNCFSARLYGLRNYKKSLKEALKDDVKNSQD
jgi:predicted site-specific integrase-resolvase